MQKRAAMKTRNAWARGRALSLSDPVLLLGAARLYRCALTRAKLPSCKLTPLLVFSSSLVLSSSLVAFSALLAHPPACLPSFTLANPPSCPPRAHPRSMGGL